MIFVLPKKANGISEVSSVIQKFNFSNCLKYQPSTQVDVRIPKFEIKESYKMNDVLSNVGIKDIFDENLSNLSRISKEQLVVSDVFHEAFIKVDETGTEAAAATAI